MSKKNSRNRRNRVGFAEKQEAGEFNADQKNIAG
jgi:hypothetical protein